MPARLNRVHTPVLEIAYLEDGDPGGTPVVLLHGFPDDASTWREVTPALVADGYCVLAPYVRGFGGTRFLNASIPRSGQIAALGQDLIEFADALHLDRYLLVGHDWGARAAYIAAALTPLRVRGLLALSVGYATSTPSAEISVEQAHAYWYQWYFGVERGRQALTNDRRAFCRYLWQVWAPSWRFDENEFIETAASFDNPDFVNVAIHSYRHRWGYAPDDPRYDEVQQIMAANPAVAVPTIMLHGDEDGATRPETSAGKDRYFTQGYRREVVSGVGHFI
jgi:pimeloyl-ACP methyl ester carboxylesterase